MDSDSLYVECRYVFINFQASALTLLIYVDFLQRLLCIFVINHFTPIAYIIIFIFEADMYIHFKDLHGFGKSQILYFIQSTFFALLQSITGVLMYFKVDDVADSHAILEILVRYVLDISILSYVF